MSKSTKGDVMPCYMSKDTKVDVVSLHLYYHAFVLLRVHGTKGVSILVRTRDMHYVVISFFLQISSCPYLELSFSYSQFLCDLLLKPCSCSLSYLSLSHSGLLLA